MTSVNAWTRAAQKRADLRAASGAINTGVFTGNKVADQMIFDGGIVAPIDNQAFQQGVDVILALQDHGFAMPANPAGAEFQQAWQDAVNRVLNGEQTPQEALDQAQQEAQSALDAAWAASLRNMAAAAQAMARPSKGRSTLQRRETLAGLAFISPWFIGFLIFTAGPMVISLALSLSDYDVIHPPSTSGW